MYDADPQAFDILRAAGCIIEAVNAPEHDSKEVDSITLQQGVLSTDEALDTMRALNSASDHQIMEILTRSVR